MNQIKLTTPFTETDVRNLKAGDYVLVSGTIHTGRDAVHQHLFKGNPAPCNLTNSIIYHCGPVTVQKDGQWQIVAAGPTTSTREEPYMASLIEKYSLRAIIGKGGMGPATAEACKTFGCIYLHAVGGAAQTLAECIKSVENVFLYEEFGAPEAIWKLTVENFPALVTIDTYGNSLHKDILKHSRQSLNSLLADSSA